MLADIKKLLLGDNSDGAYSDLCNKHADMLLRDYHCAYLNEICCICERKIISANSCKQDVALGRQYVYCNVEKFVRMKTKTQAGSLGIYNSAAKTDTPFLQTALAGAAKVNKFYR